VAGITLADFEQFVEGIISIEDFSDKRLPEKPVHNFLDGPLLDVVSAKHVFDSLDLLLDLSGLHDDLVIIGLVLGLIIFLSEVVNDHLSVDVVAICLVLVDLVFLT
jgi:hypothetical protein